MRSNLDVIKNQNQTLKLKITKQNSKLIFAFLTDPQDFLGFFCQMLGHHYLYLAQSVNGDPVDQTGALITQEDRYAFSLETPLDYVRLNVVGTSYGD
jgi:hypothetical protein